MFGQGRAQLNVWTGESPAQCLDRGEPSSMFGQGRAQLKVRTGESPAQCLDRGEPSSKSLSEGLGRGGRPQPG